MLDLFAFGLPRCSDFLLLLLSTDVGVDIDQSEARVKPMISCVHACSRADVESWLVYLMHSTNQKPEQNQPRSFASSSDWFLWSSPSVVIAQIRSVVVFDAISLISGRLLWLWSNGPVWRGGVHVSLFRSVKPPITYQGFPRRSSDWRKSLSSLRASSLIWASEALARSREAHFATQIGELARMLITVEFSRQRSISEK